MLFTSVSTAVLLAAGISLVSPVSAKYKASTAQAQRVNADIACGTNQTPQNYNAKSTVGGCPHPQCYLGPRGNVYAIAQTNMTTLPNPHPNDDTPSSRVIELALAQAPGFSAKVDGGNPRYPHSFSFILNNSSYFCIKRGDSGWVKWVPYMHCLEGVLSDCDGGSDSEYNGRVVTVCAPEFLDSDDIGNRLFNFTYTTAKEAAAATKIPAVGELPDSPGSAPAARTGLGTYGTLAVVLPVAILLSFL